jgi:hypothetical protein
MSQENTNEPLSKTAVISWFLSLQFIFKPKWWIMNKPYSKEVDLIIISLLEKYNFENISESKCTAQLGKATIWIENRPYSCILLRDTCIEKYRPSRLTILKALKKLKIDTEPSEKEKQLKYFECVSSVKHNLGLN